MNQLRKTGDQQLEAQRFAAQQASREVEMLDPRSVLLTIQNWIASGQLERAQQFIAEYRATLLLQAAS